MSWDDITKRQAAKLYSTCKQSIINRLDLNITTCELMIGSLIKFREHCQEPKAHLWADYEIKSLRNKIVDYKNEKNWFKKRKEYFKKLYKKGRYNGAYLEKLIYD